MGLSTGHFNGFMNLLIGTVLTNAAWQVYVEHKSVFATALRLTFGVGIATLGLLDLCGLFTLISFDTAIGICLIVLGVSALAVPPAPKSPRWAQWAFVAIGALGLYLRC
jgi:hypothetical protein